MVIRFTIFKFTFTNGLGGTAAKLNTPIVIGFSQFRSYRMPGIMMVLTIFTVFVHIFPLWSQVPVS